MDNELTLTFQELKPEHIELFKTNKQPILAKLKRGWWDVIYYYETTNTIAIDSNNKRTTVIIHKFQSTNCEDCWYDEDIDSWAFLPTIEKESK